MNVSTPGSYHDGLNDIFYNEFTTFHAVMGSRFQHPTITTARIADNHSACDEEASIGILVAFL